MPERRISADSALPMTDQPGTGCARTPGRRSSRPVAGRAGQRRTRGPGPTHPAQRRRGPVELLRAGDPDPTAKAMAQQAGVSLRLVFHHFSDMDDLYQFVAALQLRRQWADLPQLSPRLSLATRIERTGGAPGRALRGDLRAVRRALACRASTSPAVAGRSVGADSMLLENLEATCAPRAQASCRPARRRPSRGDGHRHLVGGLGTHAPASGMPVRGARPSG